VNDPFWEAIQSRAVHVLGLMDREHLSPTLGCMDRTHWAWKFTDFPGARFQEGLCVLSYLFTTPGPESPYHANERLRDWIAAGFDFWAGIQRSSGDFDEAYPYERSLAATAFTSFYLSEAWEFLEGDLPAATAERFRAGLARAATWLTRNDETHGFLSNHLAAAAAALHHAYRITGEERFEGRSRYFLNRILEHQSSEGWYDEYGGADPGYQTHGSFYLARLLELGADPRLGESLDRSFRFLAHFVHPDRSLGGEYASRNTQTYYPAAFEIMSPRNGVARWIAEQMRPAVRSASAAGLQSVDAYNLFPLLNNYVFAHRASAAADRDLAPAEPPGPADAGVVHFPKAGLLKVRRPRYDLYVGLGKGGVVKLFDRERGSHVASDCGYIGRLESGRFVSSQWIDDSWRVELGPDEIRIEGHLWEISRQVMEPLRFLLFRLFSLSFGRLPGAASWLKRVLVRALIYRKRGLGIAFVRRIAVGPDGIEIRDHLKGDAGAVRELWQEDFLTTIHMGSSRYFVPHELVGPPASEIERRVDPAQLGAGVERARQLRIP